MLSRALRAAGPLHRHPDHLYKVAGTLRTSHSRVRIRTTAAMFKTAFLAIFVAFCALGGVKGHSYNLGECPNVTPMSDFNMDKMLGIWYVVRKTSTSSSCLTYNFTDTGEPYEYQLEQVSQNYFLSPVDHEYHYTGRLTVPDHSIPSKMKVKFPLNFGSAAYTVFMADYDNHAAIFTCQKVAFGNRQSVSVLSRRKTLDKMYIDKIQQRLSSFGINPYDLSIIKQDNCPRINGSGYNINIDDDTFSAHSVAGVVKKAGEKLGDGIEYVATGAKKVYNKFSDGGDAHQPNSKDKVSNHPDAEWLP